eukprot:1530600-Pleurochrysis_carterae.AAC.2
MSAAHAKTEEPKEERKKEEEKEEEGQADKIDRQTNRQWGWVGGVGSLPGPGPAPVRPGPQGPQHAPPA